MTETCLGTHERIPFAQDAKTRSQKPDKSQLRLRGSITPKRPIIAERVPSYRLGLDRQCRKIPRRAGFRPKFQWGIMMPTIETSGAIDLLTVETTRICHSRHVSIRFSADREFHFARQAARPFEISAYTGAQPSSRRALRLLMRLSPMSSPGSGATKVGAGASSSRARVS